MSNLLNVVSVDPDEFTIGELPTKPGEVSLMTIEQLHDSLSGNNVTGYYVYGVKGYGGENSTFANLREVGIDWYRQKNKSTNPVKHWDNAGNGSQSLFGGPLRNITHGIDNIYFFGWRLSEHGSSYSDYTYYWKTSVFGSTYVAVVL